MHFVRTNGGVAHYADEGPRAGRAIVFINSLGTDFRIWDEVVAALKRDRRVIRYDKRGHGMSELRSGAMTLADFALDLAGLLDHLHTGAVDVVGLSIGGMIAQELYRLRRDLVASLVLNDTGHKIGTPEFWAGRIGTVESGGIDAIADAVMQRWFTEDYRKAYPDMMTGWKAMLTRTPKEGYLAACRSIREADLTEGAKLIRVPTTVIVGDQDLSTPPDLARELAGLVPNAKLEIVTGAGHLPCIEKPDVMRVLIEAHLKTVSP
jgi:3-oxoadipate enol-lactonase